VDVFSRRPAKVRNPAVFSDHEDQTQSWQERTVSVRQRQEVQEMLRRVSVDLIGYDRPRT
jgi:hypothetical protein